MNNERFRISDDCDFPGVYIILNLDNKKVYIGSTRNIRRRLIEHEMSLRNHSHQNKEMQFDYNSGNRFIGYPITSVELIGDNLCSQDDNLRYFEYKAITLFDSSDPEKGYNKRADKKECREIKKIEWAKRYIENYFDEEERVKNPKRADDIKYGKLEMETFISKSLHNKL